MALKAYQRTVYLAPTVGRSFLTLAGAANKEAAALIERKYPREHHEQNEWGRTINRGWHWTEDMRLVRLRARLARYLIWKARKANQ